MAGDLYIFRGRRGDLVKCLWHDGVGISLYAKRLERGRFQWADDVGGCGIDQRGAAGLPARGDRLAEPGSDLATVSRGLIGGGTTRAGGML